MISNRTREPVAAWNCLVDCCPVTIEGKHSVPCGTHECLPCKRCTVRCSEALVSQFGEMGMVLSVVSSQQGINCFAHD